MIATDRAQPTPSPVPASPSPNSGRSTGGARIRRPCWSGGVISPISTPNGCGLTSTNSSIPRCDRHQRTRHPRHQHGHLLPRLLDPAALPDEPAITAITLAELTVGPLVADSDSERAARQAHLQQAEADFDPLPFDAAAARAFGQVAADLRHAGRRTAARAYDALIASIAISTGLALYTVNPGDFDAITALHLVAIPHPDTV